MKEPLRKKIVPIISKKYLFIYVPCIMSFTAITVVMRSYIKGTVIYIYLFVAFTILFGLTIGTIIALLSRVEAIEQELRDLRELQKR